MIIPLYSAKGQERPRCGGKAANLSLLANAGIRIPNGYVISADAFSEFLDECDVSKQIDNVTAYNDRIAEIILRTDFTPPLIAAIEEAWMDLTGDGSEVAVRSSCVNEDTDESSFAGVYTSYTELDTLDEVITAIKSCYASLFSDVAITSSLRADLNPRDARMAVVLQKYVSGSPSGVLFTADTVSMNENRMVLNAVEGPCSNFVSGRSESIQLYIDRGADESNYQNQLNEELPVPLDRSHIEQLRAVGMEVEGVRGRYQDIEWTFADDVLWIVQARPITTMKKKIDPELWDPHDGCGWHLSSYSHSLMPLEQEAIERSLTGARSGAVETANRGAGPIFITRNGFVYTRMEPVPDIEAYLRRWSSYIRDLIKENKNVFEDVLLPEIKQKQRKLDAYMNRDLSAQDIVSFLKASLDYAEWTSAAHWKAVWGNCYVEGCSQHPHFVEDYKDQIGSLSGSEYFDLVYSPTIYSENRKALVRMASMVRNEPVLSKLFKNHSSDKIVMAHLKIMKTAKPLIAEIETFVDARWHYPCGSWREPAGPILKEEPETVISWIRAYQSISIEEIENNNREICRRKASLIRGIVAGFDHQEKTQFQHALNLAEKAYRCRDDHSHYIDDTIRSYIRIAASKAGCFMVNKGVLDRPQDVWLLRSGEIISYLSGESEAVTTELINRRRNEHRQNQSILPPATLGYADTTKEQNEPEKKSELNGISGLATKVRGTVSVCGGESLNIRHPVILVLPDIRALDIVSHLGQLIGIIVASGSPFSHIGIIARELQIPAIFDVKDAMELLHDGDEVEIDGIAEKVTILASG